MIYPKFPRRTLALILFCLLITLGAVGILFLVYFFNESNALLMDSSLKTIYGDQQQQYKKNIIANGEYNFEQKSTNRYTKDVEGSVNQVRIGNNNNRSSMLRSASSDEDLGVFAVSSSQESESGTSQGKQSSKSINSKAAKDANTNLDTIYIDDFDRPQQAYSSKTKSELSSIDYFDTILVDHKTENENKKPRKLSHLRVEEASMAFQNNFISEAASDSQKGAISNENDRKSRINSKRRENSRWKLLRYTKVKPTIRDDDDAYDLEIDSPGSGSGDFIDDTEINEIFTKQMSTRMSKKENKSLKKNSAKSNRARKKHRNYFFNNDNEYNSSPPLLLTTVSSSGLKKLPPSYPTLSAQTTEPLRSSESAAAGNKKWPAPALIFSHQKFNESDNLPTPSYNSNSNSNVQSQLELGDLGSTATARVIESFVTNLREIGASENNEAWIETRTRRIMGNVKKSEERSRQLLLCEEAGGGELCRMLFKGHIND